MKLLATIALFWLLIAIAGFVVLGIVKAVKYFLSYSAGEGW